jgi:hypothetical protein
MSLCTDCKQEQLTSNGCTYTHLRIDGIRHKRMTGQYVKDTLHSQNLEIDKDILRCDDCGSRTHFTHHFGCSFELCPLHKTPLVECDCDGAYPEV